MPTRAKIRLVCIWILWGIAQVTAMAEGTKQIQPQEGFPVKLDFNNPELTSFALFDAAPQDRLHFTIKDPRKEVVYIGFGQVWKDNDKPLVENSTLQAYYRIKDPQGNIVVGSLPLPMGNTPGQTGFIYDYNSAVAGPAQIVGTGGYNGIYFEPATSGHYYIELSTDPLVAPRMANPRVFNSFKMNFFDLTVYDTVSDQVQLGRLWSRAWSISTLGPNNPCNTRFFVKTDSDSLVSKVDLNGMLPWGFAVMCNSYGKKDQFGNILNVEVSRQSASNNAVIGYSGNTNITTGAEFQLFLNPPDPQLFPVTSPASYSAEPVVTGCKEQTYFVQFSSNKLAYFEMYIELNGIPGYQDNSADLRWEGKVFSGAVNFPRNGWTAARDGLGRPIPDGRYKVYTSLMSGLTFFPMWDVEQSPNGVFVEPVGSNTGTRVRWDDRALTKPDPNNSSNQLPVDFSSITWPYYNLDGNPANQRFWQSSTEDRPTRFAGYGNQRTLITWWPANAVLDTLQFDVVTCENPTINRPPVLRKDTLIVGSGGGRIRPCDNNTDPDGDLTFAQPPTLVIRNVSRGGAVYNPVNCEVTYIPDPGFFGRDTMVIRFCDTGTPQICRNDTIIFITNRGGPGPGPDPRPVDTSQVRIPEGFSPDGDNINDRFVILGLQRNKCSFEVYNRWGTQLYRNDNYLNDWDGTPNAGLSLGSGPVPDGTYFYRIQVKGKVYAAAFTIKRRTN